MSDDGIIDGIFLTIHRTFLLSYFRGCWLLDIFFRAQSMYTYIEAAIELAATVFIKQLWQHGHKFCDKTKLPGKETL